ISPGSEVFLTNIYDELVAVPKRMHRPPDAADQLSAIPKLDSVPLTAVRVLVAALQAHGVALQALDRARQFTFRDSTSNETYFVTLTPLSQMGLVVSVVIPESDILGAINRNTHRLLLGLPVLIVVIVIVGLFLTVRLIGVPLARVTANLRQLEDFRP